MTKPYEQSIVPDEAPQDVRVTLIDQTTVAVSWHPPSLRHVNGELAGYRVTVVPTGGSVGPAVPTHGNGNASNNAAGQIRNVTAGYRDAGKEVVGNLTTGQRYRITVAARTDAGLGVSSRPLYIKMGTSVASFDAR